MSNLTRSLTVAGACLALIGCSSSVDSSVVTETVTATVTAEGPGGVELRDRASPTIDPTSATELRAMIEEAVADSNIELTPQLCADWDERRVDILELMTGTIVERLGPLQPNDPQEVIEVSAEVIGEHIDGKCGVVASHREGASTTSMAAAAGLDDCNEPWSTRDHVGNEFTVTLCGTTDGLAVSLYEYKSSQFQGMAREYTDTAHVTRTWAVAASTDELLFEIVAKLEAAAWTPSGQAVGSPAPSSTESAAPPKLDLGSADWDVVEGDYYATVYDCPTDADGDPVAMVAVRNASSKEADLLGIVEIVDTTTERVHSYAFYQAWNVPPEATESTEAVGFEGVPAQYSCEAITVGVFE